MGHKDITPEEERDLIESTERGEWRSVGNTDARRGFWRESAQFSLSELQSERLAMLLADAIQRRRKITFWYADHLRTAEPYILGFNDRRKLMLTAVQISGGIGTGWRSYAVEKMSEIVVLDVMFGAGAPGYNPADTFYAQILAQYEDQMAGYKEVLAKAA